MTDDSGSCKVPIDMDAAQAKALAKLGAVIATPNDWAQRRYDAIMECRASGLSYQAIADAIGISRQSVHGFVQAWQHREKGAA